MARTFTPTEKKSRLQFILNAAVLVASRRGGWIALSRVAIARQAGVSEGLVSVYLGPMNHARKLIMREAIKRDLTDIVEQSRAAHDGYAPR